MHDHNKDNFTLDVISAIDEDIIDKNLRKRFELWFKKGKRKTVRWVPIVAAAACLCIIISALAMLLPGGSDKQIPVYRGMTVSNEPPATEQVHLPTTYPTFSLLSTSTLPPYDISLLGNDDAPGQNKPNENQGNYNDAPDIVFGQTYYAMKNEDIYIHIHLSNPDEFEILSFTLNGKKYSSNMFEYGSDLQTLILKYNVGDVDGLQEYTIDAIKYVDGEKIKDVRMEGDKTVKVFVNDEKDLLQFNAELSFMTLTIAPTKPLISLALYEGETLLRTLSPTDTEITDLPFDKRLILKATYSDGTRTREAQHIFDTQKLSQGLIIDAGGVIRGMGSCTDTELYINNPVGEEAFASIKSIVEVHMGPGVTSIGSKAFYECSALTKVLLPTTLEIIEKESFHGCKSLKNIAIPEGIETIPQGTFRNCDILESVTFPSSLTTIGVAAFQNCKSLVSITFPDNLKVIEDYAFGHCSALTDLSLPESMTSMGNGVFGGCTSLRSFTVPGFMITVTQHFWPGSQSKDDALKSIIFSAGVKILESGAIMQHFSLTSVTLPKSITSMGTSAFLMCPKLTDIYYEGTIAEWNSIKKDPNWAWKDTPITVVHCSDGDIIIE